MIVNDIFFYMVYNTVVFLLNLSLQTVILYRISSAIVIIWLNLYIYVFTVNVV